MTAGPVDQPPPLLSLRSALIVLIGLVVGLILGGLMFWATESVPSALIAGLTAFGGAVPALDKLIGT